MLVKRLHSCVISVQAVALSDSSLFLAFYMEIQMGLCQFTLTCHSRNFLPVKKQSLILMQLLLILSSSCLFFLFPFEDRFVCYAVLLSTRDERRSPSLSLFFLCIAYRERKKNNFTLRHVQSDCMKVRRRSVEFLYVLLQMRKRQQCSRPVR